MREKERKEFGRDGTYVGPADFLLAYFAEDIPDRVPPGRQMLLLRFSPFNIDTIHKNSLE